jgi:hypothetical protein
MGFHLEKKEDIEILAYTIIKYTLYKSRNMLGVPYSK